MTASGSYRPTGPHGDRAWGREPTSPGRTAVRAGVLGLVIVALGLLGVPWWFLALPAAVMVVVVPMTMRTADRVTLRGDGTLELDRTIGTVRIPVSEVRALRLPWFDEGESAVRVVTARGTHRIHREIDDLYGLTVALRESSPRIEMRRMPGW